MFEMPFIFCIWALEAFSGSGAEIGDEAFSSQLSREEEFVSRSVISSLTGKLVTEEVLTSKCKGESVF